ncbi:MAG: methionyl-tRNA formyltransferase [Spirochaetia bacterium]|nr:methionyl-tRNA formyltransferase [Spirochaetia bacterium]
MNIAFFGTPSIAVPVLKTLIGSRHRVSLVVSRPDRPKGRSMEMEPTPVKKCALEASIPVLQPERVKEPSFMAEYKNYPVDLNLIMAFGQIIPDELIYAPKYAGVNIHASLLPKYRGAAPINAAIINGDSETGITYQFIEKRLDAGDILHQERIKIDESDDAVTLFDKIGALSAASVLKVLDMIESGNFTRVKQDETNATTVKILSKESGKIDFNKPAVTIARLVRGLVPWPTAWCMMEGKSLKILKASAVPAPDGSENLQPGAVAGLVKGEGFLIKTSDGCLLARMVQPESGKKMGGADFANGHKGLEGIILK